nr:uncharacterized protein LOC113714046 [Coffea arabica]
MGFSTGQAKLGIISPAAVAAFQILHYLPPCFFLGRKLFLLLLSVLRLFRFSETWIDVVWWLVSNVWFSVLINGVPQGFFPSTRGLRQGDPLSPALFIIGAEALSRALNALVEQRQFHPYKVPIGCSIVTHLSFADDVVIFTSGLKFSLRLLVRAFNGISKEGLSGQILGLPVIHWSIKEGVLWGDLQRHCQQNFILEAANSVTRGKSGASQARSILSVDSLIGNSVASQGSLAEMDRVMAAFLWGASEFDPRFHWMKWADLCRSYSEGG